MNGTKAKKLRREVYGKGMPRNHKHTQLSSGAIQIVSDRQKYQALKRIIRYATF